MVDILKTHTHTQSSGQMYVDIYPVINRCNTVIQYIQLKWLYYYQTNFDAIKSGHKDIQVAFNQKRINPSG